MLAELKCLNKSFQYSDRDLTPEHLPHEWGLINLKSTYCGFVFLISCRSLLIETSSATAIPPDSIASFQVIPNFLRLI